ncbi:MAG: protein kinase [Muribaculaceae bacterium]|nr:protein kinase [Muribaculaceae bacterium]
MQSSNLKIGTILKSPSQEYRIEKILGSGSFGITYLATSKVKYGNVSFNVKFAIKEHFMESCYRDDNGVQVHCTPTSRNNVEQSRKDFLNEARRLQDLCKYSRNIVQVNEAFEANGTAYYVMEYLDGGSPGIMDELSAVSLISQIAGAVKILHDNKLLHLDIKPDNIVLKKAEDESYYPVLIDFGITKHFDKEGNPTSSPNAKGISLGYAPIEQNDVIRGFAPTLDIYALGATLLYLLTGKNPPSSVNLIDPSQRELKKLIPAQVSSSTRNTILKAMNPNKNDRTQNVSSFLKDLNIRHSGKEKSGERVVSDAESFDKRSNTEPIDIKKTNTEPITDSYPKKLKGKSKWNISHYVALVTLLMAAFGFWLYDPNLFVTSIMCMLGIVVDYIICHFLGKWLDKNPGLFFSISLIAFACISQFLHPTGLLPVVIIECVASLLMIVIFLTPGKNHIRWVASIAFLGIAAFEVDRRYNNDASQSSDISETSSELEYSNESISNSDEIVCEVKIINGHDCVDLGLSVNWATYNLGAGHFGGAPEVLGDFYAFGELTPIEPESDKNPINISGVKTMNKNITWLRDHNIVNSDNNLTSKYDAATHEWGDKWRTPTIEELKELFSKCKREIGKIDGRNGIWLTGPSGATIFLPAQGIRTNKGWDDKDGSYLSSTVFDTGDTHCYGISFAEDTYMDLGFNRNNGYLIRPVSNKH